MPDGGVNVRKVPITIIRVDPVRRWRCQKGAWSHRALRVPTLLAQPLQLSPRLIDLRKGKTQLRQRQAQPPGNSFEVCTKLAQPLRTRLHKSAPASVR